MKTCYMCEAEAVPGQGEHVPPRCVFPDKRELRKNLITVPSCAAHNVDKSANDQLLCHYLTTADGNNASALEVFDQVVMPALEDTERPYLVKTFLPNLRPVDVGRRGSGAYTLDLDRFFEAVKCIVRGLYFHETGLKLIQELEVIWAPLRYSDLSESPFKAIVDKWEPMLRDGYIGANPTVFQYAFHYFGGQSHWLSRLRFYEGPPIYSMWENDAQWPPLAIHTRWRFLERPMPDAFADKLAAEQARDCEALATLARDDFGQFRMLVPLFVCAKPFKQTKDGVDGLKFFRDVDGKEAHKVIVVVKAGNISTDDVRAIAAARLRQDAELALLISLDRSTEEMAANAEAEGFYISPSGGKFPRVQLLTLGDLLKRKVCAEHPDHAP